MRTSGLIATALLALGSAASAAEPALEDGTKVGDPVTHRNLTIIPLVGAAAAKPGEDYVVLDEGMDKGLVKIHEREGGGSVNELVLENKARKPLFLMSGEVILGGQQDRIIGKDIVIPPGQRKEVPVFCVEHGRWSGADKSFRTAKAMAHTELRKKASFDGQGEVWNEVAAKNKVRGTENASDTYRRVATEKSVNDAVKPYADALGKSLAARPDADRTVGMAVALNGKIVAIEQFESPGLFNKVKDKLLRSYFVQAVDAPTDAGAKPPSAEDVVTFAKREKETAAETVIEDGANKTQRLTGKGVKGTKVMDAESPSEAKPVYKSLHAE